LENNVNEEILEATIPYADVGLQRKCFLLSGYEVGFTVKDNNAFFIEGVKLDYFESTELRKANYNNNQCFWWLRSRCEGFNNMGFVVKPDGNYDVLFTHFNTGTYNN
jgi:hypothetical protein